MSAAGAIAVGEIRRLYRRPLTWAVLAVGEAAMAVFFMLLVIRYLEHEADLRGAGVTVEILARYFVVANLSVLLAAPLITMTSIAGDRQDGMLRFLFSTPSSAADIVIGKLAGVMSLAIAYVGLVALIPVTLFWGAPIDPGVYVTNVLGLALFTLMHTSLGLLASALTRAPGAAAMVSLGLGLALWLAEWASRLDREASIVGSWSTLSRLRGFGQGLVNTADIAYFLLASVLGGVLCCLLVAAERDST